METIAIFCTRMPRDAVRLCGKKWKTQEKSHPEQVSSSGPEVEERIDVKNSNSLKASPATWVKKKSLSMVDKMKKIVM